MPRLQASTCAHTFAGFTQRFPLYMLAARLEVWEWAYRTDIVWWDRSLSLRARVQPSTEALDHLVRKESR